MSDWLSARPGSAKPLLTPCSGDALAIGSRPATISFGASGSGPTPSSPPVKAGEKFGYAGVPLVAQDKDYTCWYAAACMVSYFYRAGPRLGLDDGHVIVLVGVDGDKVWFNDPDGGVQKQNTVKWFNQRVARQVPGHMLRKDLSRS